MKLPEPDPSDGLLERNINRTAQLLKVMRNLNVAGDLQAAG